jgi:hypothetical protein
MFASYIYIAALSIGPDREALFNEVYDAEHVPELGRVPGVTRITRFRRVQPESGGAYLAVYELDHPDVPQGDAWNTARDVGRWPTEVRPYLTSVENGTFRRVRTIQPQDRAASVGDGDTARRNVESLLAVARGPASPVPDGPQKALLDALASDGVREAAAFTEVSSGAFLVAWSGGEQTDALAPVAAATAELPAGTVVEAYRVLPRHR